MSKVGGNIIAVEEVPADERLQYGIVGSGESVGGNGFRITEMVEKPKPGTAPSNLASSPAAISCSRKSSTCSRSRSAAPAAKSSSPIPC